MSVEDAERGEKLPDWKRKKWDAYIQRNGATEAGREIKNKKDMEKTK